MDHVMVSCQWLVLVGLRLQPCWRAHLRDIHLILMGRAVVGCARDVHTTGFNPGRSRTQKEPQKGTGTSTGTVLYRYR